MSRLHLRPIHLLTERVVVRRPADTTDGQGGYTEAMRFQYSVRGRVVMSGGERARLDSASGKLLALQTASAWIDALPFIGAKATAVLQQTNVYANDVGVGGNAITVRFLLPGVDGAISVAVAGLAITVTLARTGGVSVSTAAQVVAAISANLDASALITAWTVSGATVQTAIGPVSLTGGVDAVIPRERDELVSGKGVVWQIVSAGEQNGLVKLQLVARTR